MFARLIGLAVIALVALQVPFLIRGDYSRQLVLESTSPDGSYLLEVRRQAAFPALRNPSGSAYFAIIDARTHRPNARTVVPLRRVSEFKPASVQWTNEAVRVLDFEQRQSAEVRLLLPR